MFPLGLGLAILCLDQWTKSIVRLSFFHGEIRPVINGFFNLVYVRNDGAAWNLLSGQGGVLIAISLVVLLALAVYGRRVLMDSRVDQVLYGLLLGGIAGNLADRVRFGWVTDFLDFQFGSYHYPAFNIADTSICIAVALYLFSNFQKKRMQAANE